MGRRVEYRTALSPREREVARLLLRGLATADIAHRLGIKPATVKVHLDHIYTKLGVRGRYELAALAWREEERVS